MVFEDRILKNPRLLRLRNPKTGEIIDWEIQDLTEDEIEQEGTEINAELLNKIFKDTGWQDFTWVNDTFINDTYSHYSSNKWRVKSDILFISIGVGNSSGSLDTSTEQEIARIPITGNESFATSNTRILTGAVGEAGAYGGFMIRQLTDYISVYLKPHTSSNGQVGVWYSGHFAVPLDDTCVINIEDTTDDTSGGTTEETNEEKAIRLAQEYLTSEGRTITEYSFSIYYNEGTIYIVLIVDSSANTEYITVDIETGEVSIG